jgi:hypothetical protein
MGGLHDIKRIGALALAVCATSLVAADSHAAAPGAPANVPAQGAAAVEILFHPIGLSLAIGLYPGNWSGSTPYPGTSTTGGSSTGGTSTGGTGANGGNGGNGGNGNNGKGNGGNNGNGSTGQSTSTATGTGGNSGDGNGTNGNPQGGSQPPSAPEPPTLIAGMIGLGMLSLARWWRRRKEDGTTPERA